MTGRPPARPAKLASRQVRSLACLRVIYLPLLSLPPLFAQRDFESVLY